ncbi:hypothetical protein PVAP13_7KG343440 [Panicum virgatum]|uniref:Uncharacterized protein n=1 Tax=Panicum virgatum TaxID=38727 RepID=A0A8T0QLW5_PANVG|nr:hypothetical protein PVAP13_7KG343440 [Panicum virgatum]
MFQASAFCSDGAGELKAGWFGGRCHWRVGVAGHVTRRWSPPFLGLGTHGWWLCQRDAGSPYPFAGRAGRRWVTTKTDATCDGKMIVLVGEKLGRSVPRAVVGCDRCSLHTTPMLKRNSHVGRNVGSADDDSRAATARIDRDQMSGECPARRRRRPRQDTAASLGKGRIRPPRTSCGSG